MPQWFRIVIRVIFTIAVIVSMCIFGCIALVYIYCSK